MKSKLFWLVSLLVIASVLLSACGGGAVTPAPAAGEQPAATTVPVSTGEKTKVVIFIGMGTGTDPDQITLQEALAKKYNETHDNIEIEFLIVPTEEANDRYLSMVAGGNAPQLVGPNGVGTVAAFLDTWEDITPYVKRDNYDMSDFYGPSITLNKYPNLDAGLPLGLYPSFLFYNKDAFDAAGLEYPTHDFNDKTWTYAKLREIAIKLTKDKNGNTPLDAGFNPEEIEQWGFDDSWVTLRGQLVGWGPADNGRPTTPDYKTATINNPNAVQGMQWMSDGMWKDYFMPNGAGLQAIDAATGDPFAGGHVAIFQSHTWYMSEGVIGAPFKLDIAPVPFNPSGTRFSRAHADLFTMPKTAKNKDAAWEVMKWLVSPEMIVEVCQIYGCLPARKSSQDAYLAFLKERYPGLDYDVIFKSIDYLENPNHESWTPEVGRVEEILGNTLSIMTTGGNKDGKALLDQANSDIQKILDEYWKTH